MEKAIRFISTKMVRNGVILKEEQEIYDFGIECMFLKIVHYTSYIIIALIMKSIWELLIIGFVFGVLRKSAGGYHAKTRIGCYFVSCTTVVGVLLFYKCELSDYLFFVLGGVSSIISCVLAPVDNENKKMCHSEIIFYRKKTRILIAIMNLLIVVGYIYHMGDISKMIICGSIVISLYLIAGKLLP